MAMETPMYQPPKNTASGVAEDPLCRLLVRVVRQALVDLGRLADGHLLQVHPLLEGSWNVGI